MVVNKTSVTAIKTTNGSSKKTTDRNSVNGDNKKINGDVENKRTERSKITLKTLHQERGLGENWKITNKDPASDVKPNDKKNKEEGKNKEFEKFQGRITSAFDRISEAQKKILDNLEKFFEQKKELLEKNDDDFLKDLLIVLLSQRNQQSIRDSSVKSLDQNKAL